MSGIRCGSSRRARPYWSASLLVVVVALASCGWGEKHDPGSVAMRLFELALIDEPTDEQLLRAFDPLPPAEERAALLDALSTLVDATSVRIVDVDQPAGPDDAFADLAALLPGGGSAHFTVRLRKRSEGPDPWRVTWFQGPGVEWPAAGSGRGSGLSTSAPPEQP